mgnify:CR=1 FL=1
MRLNLMITSMEYDGPMRLCEFDGDLPGLAEGDRGTVGRSKNSHFPIADASVSRQHFCVVYRAGAFCLRNMSKNGTSINGNQLLLQIDEEAPIKTGDRIYAGEVEILVTVVDTEAHRPAAPPAARAPAPVIPDAPLFPGFEAPQNPPQGRVRREPQHTGESPPRPAPPPIELAAAPAAARARTPLPDDFDLAALLGIGDVVSGPAPVMTAPAAVVPPASSAPPRVPVTTGPALPAISGAMPIPVAVRTEAPGDAAVLVDILTAAGLPESKAREIAHNLRPADLGRVLAASVRALANLQAVREKFARNFRLNSRDIAREGNNPFQHHDHETQLLERLFQAESGFLSGAEAVGDAEFDLQRHQIAVAEALRRAFLSLVDCFRPEHFEGETQRGFFEKLAPAAREAAAWRAFRDMYASNFADAQRAFLVIYLDRFRKDYEEVLAQTGSRPKKRPPGSTGA